MLVTSGLIEVMLVLRSSQKAWQFTTSVKWNRYPRFPSVLEVICEHQFCKDNQCVCASTKLHLGPSCIFPDYSSILSRRALVRA